jgi:hypothetical protein
VTSVFPDIEERDAPTVVPAFDPPGAPPDAVDPSRLVREGFAGDGWFRYVAGDGSFALIGPGRPEQQVSARGGRYTFRVDDVTLVAEVGSARGLGNVTGRLRLERATAFFLDDLGAIERARRWSVDRDDVVLEVDARRGDTRFRIRTFGAGRRIFRAYALWERALSANGGLAVERFLDGLQAEGAE